MNSLQVGTDVKCIASCDGKNIQHFIGKIVYAGKRATVQFERNIGGHDAYGKGKQGHCWVMNWESIALVQGDSMSCPKYSNGYCYSKKQTGSVITCFKNEKEKDVCWHNPFSKKFINQDKEDSKMSKDRIPYYEVVVWHVDGKQEIGSFKAAGETHESIVIDNAEKISIILKNLKRKDVEFIFHQIGDVPVSEESKDCSLVFESGKYKLIKEKN